MSKLIRAMSVEVIASYYTTDFLSDKNISLDFRYIIITIYVVVVLKLIPLQINGLLHNIQGHYKV